MRLGLLLKTVAVKTKKEGAIGKEKEIGAGEEIDAAEGDTNKAIKPHALIFAPFHSAFSRNLADDDPFQKPYVFVAESVQCNVTTSMPDNARMDGVDQESVFAVINQLGQCCPWQRRSRACRRPWIRRPSDRTDPQRLWGATSRGSCRATGCDRQARHCRCAILKYPISRKPYRIVSRPCLKISSGFWLFFRFSARWGW